MRHDCLCCQNNSNERSLNLNLCFIVLFIYICVNIYIYFSYLLPLPLLLLVYFFMFSEDIRPAVSFSTCKEEEESIYKEMFSFRRNLIIVPINLSSSDSHVR